MEITTIIIIVATIVLPIVVYYVMRYNKHKRDTEYNFRMYSRLREDIIKDGFTPTEEENINKEICVFLSKTNRENNYKINHYLVYEHIPYVMQQCNYSGISPVDYLNYASNLDNEKKEKSAWLGIEGIEYEIMLLNDFHLIIFTFHLIVNTSTTIRYGAIKVDIKSKKVLAFFLLEDRFRYIGKWVSHDCCFVKFKLSHSKNSNKKTRNKIYFAVSKEDFIKAVINGEFSFPNEHLNITSH